MATSKGRRNELHCVRLEVFLSETRLKIGITSPIRNGGAVTCDSDVKFNLEKKCARGTVSE